MINTYIQNLERNSDDICVAMKLLQQEIWMP